MATLSVQTEVKTGLAVTFNAAAAGGDAFVNNGRTRIIFKNANVSVARTVTIVTQNTVDGLAVADRTITVAASTTVEVPPLEPQYYNDANKLVQMTYSSEADLTIALIKEA